MTVLTTGVFRMVLGGLAVLGLCTHLTATRWGIGLGPDSVVYVGMARSLLSGAGGVIFLSDIGDLSPVTHFPPLYPWIVAGFGLLGVDPLVGARWTNALLFSANIVLVGCLVYSVTRSYGASILASFLAYSSFPMVQIHSMAWSEPAFIFFGFLGLSFLITFLQTSKPWMLYFSSSAIALSCLARYAGLAYALTGVVGILFLSEREWKKRLADAACFSALSCLPLLLWVVRNSWVAGNAFNRTLGFHPPGLTDLVTAMDSLSLWVLPVGIFRNALWMRLLGLGIILLCVWWLAGKNSSESKFSQLAGLFLLGYGLFVVIARCFADVAITFDTRILSPAYVAAMTIVLSVISAWVKRTRLEAKSWSWFLFDCFIIAVLMLQMTNGVSWLSYSYADGIGYASKSWRASELIKFLTAVDPSIPVFTNAPDFIYMLTSRRAAMIPNKVDPDTRLPNNEYRSQIANMKRELRDKKGVLIYFHAEKRLWYLPSETEIQKDAGLRLVALEKDGYVFKVD